MCVCSLPIYSGHQPLDVPAGVTQEEGHAGFLFHLPAAVRALIFLARKIHLFLSLVDREVEFCVLTILHLLGNFLFIYVLVRKNPMTVATSQWVCVCVCVFSSHLFCVSTSSSLDVPAGVTQEEGHTGFLIHLLSAVRALIFLARRIQPFFSLVGREVEFCENLFLESVC